ncbi:hypothetical protein M1146_05600 [Patescibacteria group bacterium]|nr:hypothetical protein [Patescibacteria group bacterium]
MVRKHSREYLTNQRGEAFVWLIIVIVIFAPLVGVALDFANLHLKTKKIKYSLNRAVKAGTLMVQEGESLAEGNFLIAEVEGTNAFYQVLSNNLELNSLTLEPTERSILREAPEILELSIHNDINNFPKDYIIPAMENRSYRIENPSIVAVVKFRVHGVFLSKTLLVDKLSSSQLTSVYQ